MNLHKSEVIELMARECETSQAEAERFLNSLFFLIYSTLSQGGEVNISGFGKFRVHETKGSLGVDPRKPKERMMRPTRKTPKFRAGEAFKAAVNKNN